MIKKYGDFIAGLCGILFSVVLFMAATQIGLKEGKAFGADFLPKLTAVGIFACSLMLTYRGINIMKTVELEKPEYKHFYLGSFGIFALMVAYAVLLKPVGFVITSIVFLFLAILLATKKENWRPVFFAILSVVLTLCVYFIFTKIFGIRIPNGLLSKIF